MPGRKTQHDLGAAITKLMSLHDGDVGVIETIACGTAAVPALHSILFSRDSSGIYEPRRRAIEALEVLKAHEALREYLSAPQDISDPIERSGEDAVINAAARALGRLADTRDMPLLFGLLRTRPLAGVIEAAGRFRQISTLPDFIRALGDDFTRSAAEAAILRFGVKARKELLKCVLAPALVQGRETSASISRRRSALRILQIMPLRADVIPAPWSEVIDSSDPWIAVWASRIALTHLDPTEHRHAIERLLFLLHEADELIAEEIEDCLVEHFASARAAIEEAARALPVSDVPIWRSRDYTDRVFERIRSRTQTNFEIHGTAL
jgi:hypothetical protein